MTVNERIEYIINKTGLSENIIRAVFKAEEESIVESLMHGETATLIGRCTLVPRERVQVKQDGSIGKCIKVSAKVAPKIESLMMKTDGFVEREDEDTEVDSSQVLLSQIRELV